MIHMTIPLAISRRCTFNSVTVLPHTVSNLGIAKRDQPARQFPLVYSTLKALAESLLTGGQLIILSALVLLCLQPTALSAQALYYVNSPQDDLNVRLRSGTEHSIVTKLPHGTPVIVEDRDRLWLKIVAPELGIEGWVSQRYLVDQPPGAPPTPGELGRSQERERFKRLQRKGVIYVKANKTRSVLHIQMSHLIWHRFNRLQQKNFLERASRLYQINIVELRDRRGIPQSRLRATGLNAFSFEPLN